MKPTRLAGIAVLVVGIAGTGLAAPAAETTLADAAEHANRVLVRTLLQGGADVNARQVDGMTALHWAVYHDDAETAALLVRAGANVTVENRYGVSPLSVAATNGNADVVTLLLDAGANANTALRGRGNRSDDRGAHRQSRRGESPPGPRRRPQRPRAA